MYINQSHDHRQSGATTVSTTSVPLTRITLSGSGTTFTSTTGVDAAAWDLSGVLAGDVAIVGDVSGLITAVDDGNDTITIGHGWKLPGVPRSSIIASAKPTDGTAIAIHRRSRAKSITIQADGDNTDIVYLARHGTASATDFKLAAGDEITLYPEEEKYVNVPNVAIIAATGSQTVNWIVGGSVGTGGSGAGGGGGGGGGSFTANRAIYTTGALPAGATPAISASYYYTNNGSPTSITNFTGGSDGMLLFIEFGDDNTTLVHGATILLEGALNFTGKTGDMLQLLYRSGVWRQASQAVNSL